MRYLTGIIKKAQEERVIKNGFKAEQMADIFASVLSTTIVGLLKEEPEKFKDPDGVCDFIFDIFMNGVGV